MKALVKLLMVVDTKLVDTTAHARMDQALEKLAAEVLASSNGEIGLSWVYGYAAFKESEIPWVRGTYNGKVHYYPRAAWAQETNDLYDMENTSVQLVIHPDNWKDPDSVIGGINFFQTQIIHPKLSWGVNAWKITIEEELLHSFDNRGAEFDADFEAALGVDNFDRDVVHKTDPVTGKRDHDYSDVWSGAIEEIAKIYPNNDMLVDTAKLRQITNEILLRDPITGDEKWLNRPEDEVRAEVGATPERWDIINLYGAALKIFKRD